MITLNKSPFPGPLSAQCSPHQLASQNTSRIMWLVIVACIPGVLISTWFFGIGTLLNILLASTAAVALEALCLMCRGRPVAWTLADNSALVTAVVLGISLPPGTSWWLIIAGVFVAIVVCKHLSGGLGQNLFNPAMCGYGLLLLFFPLEMTGWRIPVAPADAVDVSPLMPDQLLTSLQYAFGWYGNGTGVDGLSMATPLMERNLAAQNAIYAVLESGGSLWGLLDRSAGTGWELTGFAYLSGGIFLLVRRVIGWQIPLAIIATVSILSLAFYSDNYPGLHGSTYLHLFSGSTMLGAFFIATDPVSSASTTRGKLLYGLIIGILIYSIRVWSSYPDSIAFAVLAGNLLVPLIDRYNQPRIVGHPRVSP